MSQNASGIRLAKALKTYMIPDKTKLNRKELEEYTTSLESKILELESQRVLDHMSRLALGVDASTIHNRLRIEATVDSRGSTIKLEDCDITSISKNFTSSEDFVLRVIARKTDIMHKTYDKELLTDVTD